MSTRKEHLEWCKERALAELKSQGPQGAIASMTSDMNKHPETRGHAVLSLGMMLLMSGNMKSDKDTEKWVNDFQ